MVILPILLPSFTAVRVHEERWLREEDRAEYTSIIRILDDPAAHDKNTLLARLGSLASKADVCDPVIDGSAGMSPGSNGRQRMIFTRFSKKNCMVRSNWLKSRW